MRLSRMTTRRRFIAVSVVFLAPIAILAGPLPPEDRYFPDGVFDSENAEHNDFLDKLYSAHLRAMGEPSLWAIAKRDRAATDYRLLWVPSFHQPISVRFAKSGNSYTAHHQCEELEGKGQSEPGKIAVKRTVKLTEDQWTWIMVYLERTRFWKMPTSVKTTEPHPRRGDRLVCEGGRGQQVSRRGTGSILILTARSSARTCSACPGST